MQNGLGNSLLISLKLLGNILKQLFFEMAYSETKSNIPLRYKTVKVKSMLWSISQACENYPTLTYNFVVMDFTQQQILI